MSSSRWPPTHSELRPWHRSCCCCCCCSYCSCLCCWWCCGICTLPQLARAAPECAIDFRSGLGDARGPLSHCTRWTRLLRTRTYRPHAVHCTETAASWSNPRPAQVMRGSAPDRISVPPPPSPEEHGLENRDHDVGECARAPGIATPDATRRDDRYVVCIGIVDFLWRCCSWWSWSSRSSRRHLLAWPRGGRKVLAWSQEHLPRETLSGRGGVKTDYSSAGGVNT